jgi:hypothetical protein
MKETGRTAASKAFTGKHETASFTTQQAAITAKKRAAELKKKRAQKRTLYIVFTALAAATIIVVAFILKGAAEQRSYNTYYSSALQEVMIPISYDVTFKVSNGLWNDGTAEDKWAD